MDLLNISLRLHNRLSKYLCMGAKKRVAIFREKKNSAEHGRDGNFGSFRRNSVCSAERKMFGIPFRVIPRKIKKNSEFCFYKMKSIVFVFMLSIPSNLIFPRNSFRSVTFRGITKTVPSLFRGFFFGTKFRWQP